MFDEVVRGIRVYESENPPVLVDMTKNGDLLFCKKFTQNFLIRKEVCNKVISAQKKLHSGYRFMIYEAFRPRGRQVELWNNILAQLKREHPDWDDKRRAAEASDKYVANPYGFGSGHQAGAAIDITLCSASGQEFFMGTAIDEFNAKTQTDCATIKKEEAGMRILLRQALESEGLINYPDEWWHFSYGDRLWAEATGRVEAFYAPID